MAGRFIVKNDDYEAHVQDDGHNIVSFEIYEKVGELYKGIDDDFLDDFNPEECTAIATGVVRWPGSWDCRVYFPEGVEFWAEDITGLGEFIHPYLTDWCKVHLRLLDKGIFD